MEERLNRIKLDPLPVVDGVKFRGLSTELKKNMCLTQALISIYKFVSISFGYREAAYSVFLHDELSEIALVCQSIPRALQYICYTIDTIFLDGLNDADDDALSHFSHPSMQVSAEPKKPPRLALGEFHVYFRA